jgi:hypothetical protein
MLSSSAFASGVFLDLGVVVKARKTVGLTALRVFAKTKRLTVLLDKTENMVVKECCALTTAVSLWHHRGAAAVSPCVVVVAAASPKLAENARRQNVACTAYV